MPALIKFAKQYEIKNYSRMRRAELENKLIEAIKKPIPETKTTKEETPEVFFDRVSKIVDESELKTECEKLIDVLGLKNLKPRSLSNKLRPYTRLFETITPINSGLPTELFFSYSYKGKNPIDRHKFFKFTGHADIDWGKADEDVRARKTLKSKSGDELADALNEVSKVFSVEKYIKTLKQLLNSTNPWELGIGLIAASARRPFEIVILTNFETVDNVPKYITYPEYAVKVDRLAKKRDKNPETIVPLLIPTNEFLEALTRFRNNSEVKEFKKVFDNLLLLGTHESDAWKSLENTIGGKLRKETENYFDFLPKINDEQQNRKNILLRACTLKLLTMRDYPKANKKASLQYAGVIAGHIIPIFKDDGSVVYDGKTSASTLNYDDYEPDNKDIPRLNNIVNFKLKEDNEDMAKTAELNAKIEHLQKLINVKDEEITTLKFKLNNRKNELPNVKEMDNLTLFNTRKEGASEEKLNRVWEAISDYNDSTEENKISPTNQVLRHLTKVNGKAIKKWIENNEKKVTEQWEEHKFKPYYNNKYRNKSDININTICEIIEKEYLKNE